MLVAMRFAELRRTHALVRHDPQRRRLTVHLRERERVETRLLLHEIGFSPERGAKETALVWVQCVEPEMLAPTCNDLRAAFRDAVVLEVAPVSVETQDLPEFWLGELVVRAGEVHCIVFDPSASDRDVHAAIEREQELVGTGRA